MTGHGQDFVRVNLVLTRELSAWTDQQAEAIRQTTGAVVNRSALVRAALRAVSELDLAHLKPRTESDLTALLIITVRAGRQTMRW